MAHKLKYLRDTFSSHELDDSLWVTGGPGLGFLDRAVEFRPSEVPTTLTSAHTYSLAQSEVSAYFGLMGAGETRELSMTCLIDADNSVSIVARNNTLTFRVRVAGVNNDTSVDIDRDTMTHWRIEERSGVVYFYTSDNYVGWTQQRVATHGLDLTSVTLVFSAMLDVPDDVETGYGDGEYGGGFYGGVSGADPDHAYLYSVNRQDPIPSTTPDVVIVDRTASWRWAIGPWRDNAASHELLYAGARTLQLHLKSPSEAQFTTWGQSEEAAFIEEGVSDLWVTRDADTLFRGRIIRASDELDAAAHSVNVAATDYRGVLDRRNLMAAVTTAAEEQAATVRSLITTAQEQTGGYLGILFGDEGYDGGTPWPSTGVTRTVELREGQSVYECMSLLANMDNGFDFDIDENKMFHLYYPTRGEDNGEVLDYGGNIAKVSRTLNLDKFGNAIRHSGGTDITAATEFSSNLANAPEGRWDLQFGDIDLNTADMVAKTAKAKIQQVSELLPTYRLTMGVGAWRGPGHVWLGDYVYVVVKTGRLGDVIKMRVYDLDIDVDINNRETVSITVGDPKLTVASMLHRINRNIRSLQRN